MLLARIPHVSADGRRNSPRRRKRRRAAAMARNRCGGSNRYMFQAWDTPGVAMCCPEERLCWLYHDHSLAQRSEIVPPWMW